MLLLRTRLRSSTRSRLTLLDCCRLVRLAPLLSQLHSVASQLPSPVCLEVGCGTGYVITSVALLLHVRP